MFYFNYFFTFFTPFYIFIFFFTNRPKIYYNTYIIFKGENCINIYNKVKNMPNNNLPVVKKSNLPNIIKKSVIKTGKILGFSSLTGINAIAFVLGCSSFPILILPSAAGLLYSSQKLLNETLYKSHKDVAFISRKQNGNIKIYQDVIRPDITHKLRNMTEIEKAAFMQLQAIVGISKLNRTDKNGEPIQYETDSHSIVQKTFKKLSALGLLTDYTETPKRHFFNKNKDKHSHLILPKLAFGNLKGLKEQTAIYNIKFKLGDKKVNINDPDLQRIFPLVYGKKGLLSKYNYSIIQNPDGTLSIDYNPKTKPKENILINKEDSSFREELREASPTLQEQKAFSNNFQHTFSKEQPNEPIIDEEKNL